MSETSNSIMKPTITVAVCTRNRADALRDAVRSLCQLKTNDRFEFEILIIDNGSNDHTHDVWKELSSQSAVPIRYVREDQPGVTHARNRAVAECGSDWLAFFDDDQAADPAWLLELLELTQRRATRCVGGKVVLRLPEGCDRKLHPVVRMLLGESVGLEKERPYSPSITPGAGNLMIRRDVFDDVGRFRVQPNGRGEDTELYLRIHSSGDTGWYSPEAVIHHIIPPERLSGEFLLDLSARMAVGMAEDERTSRGELMYPLVYGARWVQYLGVLWPRLLLAKIQGDAETILGLRCRLRIARDVLEDGWQLLFSSFIGEVPKTTSDHVAQA
ncbi:glycosyltransferase [Stratiformator vulcanicus]|uniref:Chondroitin synthase n=1 Tax=Stratiformator vulcanicus TaxID=2527980 RepID=A0A517R416_9PLAN|nr:glycosyltransferase [Stratiformator vulcanicus]QDT38635.1 Chondroitin synthase [Stratiformator vulcanicus]